MSEFDPTKLNLDELEQPTPLVDVVPPEQPMQVATAELAELAASLRTLPAGLQPLAELMAAVAIRRHPADIGTRRFAFWLAAVAWRETLAGASSDCDVAGAGCTGDFGARLVHDRHRNEHFLIVGDQQQLELITWTDIRGRTRHWAPPRNDKGEILPGPYAIPADRRGFGRSRWQHDEDAHGEVTRARGPAGELLVFTDAFACEQAAIRLATDYGVLAQAPEVLNKEAGTLAAFNCGLHNVGRAVALGKPVDFFTEGGNYSTDVLQHIQEWGG